MASCLGLYIEDNLIKYAKVSKEKDDIKVDAYGMKFYEDINKAIKQIVEETFSFKTPISVNLINEMYNYFDMFSLLTKKDLQKAISTEFESYCVDKGYNPNMFETRYALVNNLVDKEKVKVIHISTNKTETLKMSQQLEKYKLKSISPISMCIPNIAKVDPKENVLIVNMEEQTTITTIIDEKVYDVKIIEEGSKEILDKVNIKENSYSKSYEICKNTTIYTAQELANSENNHLEDIMPTLQSILSKILKIINESTNKITKVYLTGTVVSINNIDLYFQEYMNDIKCEILRPKFIKNITKEMNIKDYIEVNSAISLAVQGLDSGIEGINFKNPTFTDKLPSFLKINVNDDEDLEKKNKKSIFKNSFIKLDLTTPITKVEKMLIRLIAEMLIIIIGFAAFSGMLTDQISKKKTEVQQLITNTNGQISKASSDTDSLNSKTSEYTQLITKMQEANNKISEINRTKNSIPNLLNKIMNIIPSNVQLTSVENTTSTHIIIKAQSSEYSQLAYFMGALKINNTLNNIISDSGVNENGVVKLTIEGELP